ncbi:hypothetical protein GCM10027429_29470 [Marivirga atlantica]|jgi:hypothetical protein|uniref:Uncharacterized protein n=1 Tax=Marivirga atlantica TaxID=1548457 RepID=A0A937ACN8_9BACT|nr:hypothetical protein [Marivirga atlantica]MBL0766526.1 hypothetical protein [Marivirga atlantica]
MKPIHAFFIYLCLILLSCQEEDGVEPDAREPFIGTYQIDNLTGSIFQGDFSVSSNPEIEVSLESLLDEDEVFLDIEPLAEAIIEELTFFQFNTRDIIRAQISRDEQIAILSGSLFKLQDVEFITIYTSALNDNDILTCELNLSGEFNESSISFDYDFQIIGQNFSYYAEGTASGTKID